MDITGLRGETDAVSSVVGVVLMIVIVVILAGIISTFLIGLGNTSSEPVTATYEFEFAENETYNATNLGLGDPGTGILRPYDGFIGDLLTITQTGGDAIESDKLKIQVDGAEVKYINESGALKDYGGPDKGEYQPEYTFEQMEFESEVSAPDSVTLVTNYGDYHDKAPSSKYHPQGMLRDATVTLIYEGQEQSIVLDEWEG